MPQATELVDIGNVLKLRKVIDDEYRITNHIRSHLAAVDIIPLDYQLHLADLNKERWGVSYEFEKAIEEYQKVCANYGLTNNYGGVRLWLTDDTVAVDEYANQYEANVIETAMSSLSGVSQTIKTLKSVTHSTGTSGTARDSYEGITDGATGMVEGVIKGSLGLFPDGKLRQALETNAIAAARTAGEIVFKGKHISLPKIWKSSTYTPSLTLTIKLTSPYGSPVAIKEYITRQLLYLLALVSPRTNDGLTYGFSRPVRVQGYGLTNINLGYVESVSIRRGGRDVAYNVFKQPLTLDVMVSVKPLTDGFAACDTLTDVATIHDADKPYTPGGTKAPAITTLGNVIQSLRPAPTNVTDPYLNEEQLVAGKDIGAQFGNTSQAQNSVNSIS
jgi:hypothetical protein